MDLEAHPGSKVNVLVAGKYQALSRSSQSNVEQEELQASALEIQDRGPLVKYGLEYINPGGLPDRQNWHNSLVDVKAQTDITVHPIFVQWINRTDSIRTIDKIFADAVTREWKKKMEPLRGVHLCPASAANATSV